MLKDFPTYFDTTEIVRPNKWEESYEVVDTVNTTEAGTDVVDISRLSKLTVSASYKCSSDWAKKFKEFSRSLTISVKIYDTESETYKTYTMRMRDFKQKLKKGSEFVRYGNGVYEVSFKLEEY